MTRLGLIVAPAALVLVIAAPGEARAQRRGKSKPACGITYLPLVTGNQWSYEPMEAPLAPGQKKKENALPATVKSPDKVTIEVLAVKQVGKSTEITLSEKVDGFERKTKLTCTAKGLVVSPQSFFFTGGPAGGYKMTLDEVKRTGTPFPAQLRPRSRWNDAITAEVTRESYAGAAHPKTKMTVERSVAVEGREMIGVAVGQFNAWRVRIDISGRAKLMDKPDKPVEIGAGSVGVLWFFPGVGVVQARDSAGRWFQLTSKTLK